MNYKQFEKIYIGGSDGASLVLASYGKVEYLNFGEDGDYHAYMLPAECPIPDHYTIRTVTRGFLRIYDDDQMVVKLYGDFEVYRAGMRGCIIREIKHEDE